jgi:pSer/pThr/pTyr-binding forkhead associated (FHA) protein
VPPLPSALRSVSPRELAQRIAAERLGLPFLVHLDGERRQRIVELPQAGTPLSIGRGPSAGVALTWDTEVSRLHAVLECVGGEWTISDEGLSRNGSFVNGERLLGRRRLDDGDAIAVGHTVIVFRCGDPVAAQTTATTQDLAPPMLTPAQGRVLRALCGPDGAGRFTGPHSNREIAEELYLGVETVKSHLHVMFELFGLTALPQNRKRGELMRRAVEAGVVRHA